MEQSPPVTEKPIKVDARELVFVVVHPDGSQHDIPTGLYLAVSDGVAGFPGDSVPDLQHRLRTLADWLDSKAILSPRIVIAKGIVADG